MVDVELMQDQTLTADDLRQIVERASTITERLSGIYTPVAHKADDPRIAARLDEWCQTVAKGDTNAFRRRLAWDGLDAETVHGVLGDVRLHDGVPLPVWAEMLAEAVTTAALTADIQDIAAEAARFLDPGHLMPYQDILVPFVLAARQRLVAEAGTTYALLADDAHAAMERTLLSMLCWFAGQTLQIEFSIMRNQEQSSFARLLAQAQDADNRALYEQFVQQMQQGTLRSFLLEYPVLARMLAIVMQCWVESTAEFLQRLAADWNEIQRVFSSAEDELGEVVAIQPSLSDPHNGRRMVMVLTFSSGLKLVYKPKDLGTEEAYNGLLAWLNTRSAPLPFKLLAVLNRGSHGWVEFVEHIPCQDQAEAQRYFQRAGMMLCLGYVLEATDWHHENLIAHGEYPVLVDMETMLHHRIRLFDKEDAASVHMLAMGQMADSVMRMGLLPQWQTGKDGDLAYSVSGLGAVGVQEMPYKVSRWEHINTDRMSVEFVQAKMGSRTNAPRIAETPLNLAEYSDDIVVGFQHMYQFLLDQRDALAAPDGPLHELGRQQVRFIFRSTRVYALMQREQLTLRQLRDGARWSIGLDLLARAGLPPRGEQEADESAPPYWPLLRAEQTAMEHLDTPLFTARPDSDALVLHDRVIPQFFDEPSLNRVLRRLKALGPEDVRQQVTIIRTALYTHQARDTPLSPDVDEDEVYAGEPLGRKALLAEAIKIAEEIRTRALRAQDGSATWVAPFYMAQAQRYQFRPADYDLYNGISGIALFLAAVYYLEGGSEYRDLAWGAMQPLHRAWKRYTAHMVEQLGIGGASGVGSVVYALVRVSTFLDEPTLLEAARRTARLITAEQIAADKKLDVLAGTAGAALGLLALHRVAPDHDILERAVACGQHLLKQRVPSEAGFRSWPTAKGKLLSGFSHGAAGIAYALLRLYEATGNTDFLDAAREGIAYENSLYVADAGNWLDLRPEGEPSFMMGWCNGAPGIGLGRMGGLPQLDTASIRADIEAAVGTTQHSNKGLDLVCCGRMGRVELLLEAAERLGRPELVETARQQASSVLRRKEKRGAYLIHSLLPDGVYDPSFFRGTAGIGYELLRLAHPGRLPSVLLFES